MSTTSPHALAALAGRLRSAGAVALPASPAADDDPARDVGALLDAWLSAARAAEDTSTTWLLAVAVTGRLPVNDEVRAFHRILMAERPAVALQRLLDHALTAFRWTDPLTELIVVDRAVVVDVDFAARHDLNTGIQRVVRQVVPRWEREHDVLLTAWSPTGAFRPLDTIERERVLAWHGRVGEPPSLAAPRRVIVPWRSVLVLPEVAARTVCPILAALGEHSGNVVSLIGYDTIPVVSADMLPAAEPERFVQYLAVVKHATVVSAISVAAAEEFAGFADMLPTQGLRGPRVEVCPLPVDTPPAVDVAAPGDLPQVLVVGSHEPRKNHLAVLAAAEELWREGKRFELTFVGGAGWRSNVFDDAVREARRRGRPVQVARAVGDDELFARYRTARVTVFPSLHEGYGLPVAESLAVGTPVITSAVGSMAEIAAGGGALTVDPRDDAALTEAIRSLLVDDVLYERLHAEALARPHRSWDDYAAQLWQQLVAKAVPA